MLLLLVGSAHVRGHFIKNDKATGYILRIKKRCPHLWEKTGSYYHFCEPHNKGFNTKMATLASRLRPGVDLKSALTLSISEAKKISKRRL